MTRIPGATQFLSQARLAAVTGSTFEQSNVLSEAAGSAGILEVGRRISRSGVGISNDARQRIRQFVESNQANANSLFSFTGGGSATIESAQIQIAALASSTPTTRSASQSSDGVTPSANGQNVDESV